MWRRLSIQLRALVPTRSAPKPVRFAVGSSTVPANLRLSYPAVSRHFSTDSGDVTGTKRVEDVMPIATGHEHEELQAQLKGKDILEINYPAGPFGTKEEPAVIKSYYDKRIVGCPGVEGEDEHDVVWFWLEKGKPHECPVCSQYFVFFTIPCLGFVFFLTGASLAFLYHLLHSVPPFTHSKDPSLVHSRYFFFSLCCSFSISSLSSRPVTNQ